MIKDIRIQGHASYGKPVHIEPGRINLFFGHNGTGKSTLCNLINKEINDPPCVVVKEGGAKTYCYNRSFVEENFRTKDKFPGIFTIGQENNTIVEQINEKNNEKRKIDAEEKYEDQITRSIDDFEKREEKFNEMCWKIKEKFEPEYREAMHGFLGSKVAFASFCCEGY
jgi:wobble nucleotide-excising tRNase